MKKDRFHKRWGDKYGIRPEAVRYAYWLIDEPVEQTEYLEYLTEVTKWWNDKDEDYIPKPIIKECKTAEMRGETEQKYKKYLSDHIRGIIPHNPFFNKQAKGKTKFEQWFFQGRTTGRDLSRVKDIGKFQSYMQQEYIRRYMGSGERPYLLAWYLHHLIDYCHESYKTMKLTCIINRNRDRIKPIDPECYDEVASFIQQHWEELKYDFESY